MMYTIEELESTFAELEANKGHLIGVDIMTSLTEDSHVLEVMHQLLDTMRALADANARIEAAATMDSVYMVTLHYSAYERKPLAICTTMDKAKAICQSHHEERWPGVNLEWEEEPYGASAEWAESYTIELVTVDCEL